MNSSSVSVKALIPTILGWGSVIMFGVCLAASLVKGELQPVPIFLGAVALGVFLIVTTGELTVSEDEVVYANLRGTYRMSWDEIERAEVDHAEQGMILYSREPGKRLSVIGPAFWSGADKERASQIVATQMQQRQIPMRRSMRPQYTMWGGKGYGKSTL